MNIDHALDLALLVLRLAIGLTLFAHGAQKLFGWFGGGGLSGTAQTFDSIGFRPGRINAVLAGLGEAGGGLLLALGLFTPLGGAAAASTMIVAASMHAASFFSTKGGLEYPMTLGIASLVLIISGPGRFSVDETMGYPLADPWVGIAAFLVGAIAALALVVRQRSSVHAGATS